MSSPRLACLLRGFDSGFRASSLFYFIAIKTCLLTKVVRTNLGHQNVFISAMHLTHTTTVLPAERQVRATIRVLLLSLPVLFALHLLKSKSPKISHRKCYAKKSDKKDKAEDLGSDLLGDNSFESFGGSHTELEVAADRIFTSPPRTQPLSFEALSIRNPARTVPPTPGTALQLKVQANLQKSLSSHIDLQMDQKMGVFQASMLEAFNNLREDFQKSLQKQREVDQTSSSASKPNAPSKDLDQPSKASSAVESMEVKYGP